MSEPIDCTGRPSSVADQSRAIASQYFQNLNLRWCGIRNDAGAVVSIFYRENVTASPPFRPSALMRRTRGHRSLDVGAGWTTVAGHAVQS